MIEKQAQQSFLSDLLRPLFTTQKSLDEAQKTIEELVKHGAMKQLEECNPQTIRRFVSFLKIKDCRSPLTLLSSVADSDFFFKSVQEIRDSEEIYEIVFKDKPGKDVIFAFIESLEDATIQEKTAVSPVKTPEMEGSHIIRILEKLDDVTDQQKEIGTGIQITRKELLEKLPGLVVRELQKQQISLKESQDTFLKERLEKRATVSGQSLEAYVSELIALFGQKERLLDPEKDRELFLFFGILKAWIYTL